MDILKCFGTRVKELRQIRKISQEALAFKAGIDRTYMTSVENGKRNLSLKNIEKILNALEITYQDFFTSTIFNEKDC